MIRSLSRTASLGLGALLLASASLVSAQYAERPADRLARYLRELASSPESLSALIGAGQAALDVGDANAALGFFARADERSPRNGQVKAGLARAFLMTDQPRDALRMFDDARRLGISDAQIAGDRGLAYDLRGESRRAQQDYALALSRGANDEVTKRYALSLGITGERDQALKLLDPLLYKRDQGAWRARAFVLAMTGDLRGASSIVHQVMPERMAQTMDPFLARLSSLTPAERAAAVHLGEMPANVRFAANAAVPPPVQMVAPVPAPTPEAREPRRRPGAGIMVASPPPPRAARVVQQPSPTPSPTPTPSPKPPTVQQASAVAAPPLASLPADQRGDLEAIMREVRAAAEAPGQVVIPSPRIRVAQAMPTLRPTSTPTPRPSPTPTASPAKPVAKSTPVPKLGPKKDEAAAAKTKAEQKKVADAAKAKKKPEPPKNPARIWVQVAGGANVGALPKEWSGVAGKAPELKGKGPWTAKNRATNRLLAGPFKTEAEAQAAVAKLRKAGIGAFQWQSDEGEAVDKIGGK